jgi:hypothetical protein
MWKKKEKTEEKGEIEGEKIFLKINTKGAKIKPGGRVRSKFRRIKKGGKITLERGGDMVF